jgi:hypothetical protein
LDQGRNTYALDSSRLFALVAATSLLMGAGPASAKGKTPPGDPPGNNGTIKVVATDPSDPDPGNEPHLDSCLLWLEFYGFDQAQVADVTFTAHPPTGDRELLKWSGTISDDPAGGGQDDDAVIGVNLTSALQGLEPHPQQGYHVKVTSNSQGAPGGAKQKVFWLKCAPAAPGSLKVTKATEGDGAGPGPFTFDLACNHTLLDRTFSLKAGESTVVDGVPAGTTCVVAETDRGGAGGARLAESPADDAQDGKVKISAATPTTLVVTNLFGQATTTQTPPAAATPPTGTDDGTATASGDSGILLPAPGAQVGGVAVTQPDTLPRTGTNPWRSAMLGFSLLAVGGLVLTAGRLRAIRSTGS